MTEPCGPLDRLELLRLSTAARVAGRLHEARDLADRATEGLAGERATSANVRGALLHNVGLIRDALGDPDGAEEAHRAALEVVEGPNRGHRLPVRIEVLKGLATSLQAQNRGVEAEAFLLQALGLTEESLGPEHPETATLCHLLAEAKLSRGRHVEGEMFARRALEIRSRQPDIEDVHVATAKCTLAALLRSQAEYDEAELLVRQALPTLERVFGKDSYQVGAAVHELAAVAAGRGRWDEGDTLYATSVAIKRSALGTGHPDIAVTLHNWALLCSAAGRSDQARSLWNEAKAVFERQSDSGSGAENHPTKPADVFCEG